MHKHLVGGLLVFTALFFCPARAAAQVDTFMLIDNIPGEATARFHENWIVVTSLTQSFDALSRVSTACTAVVGKNFDKAGPLLWLAAVTGQRLGDVRIEVIKSGGDTQRKLYDLTITNARISAITSEPSHASESLQIVGTTAVLTDYLENPTGGPAPPPVTATVPCK